MDRITNTTISSCATEGPSCIATCETRPGGLEIQIRCPFFPCFRDAIQSTPIRPHSSLDMGIRDSQITPCRSGHPHPDHPASHLQRDLPAPGECGTPSIEGRYLQEVR